MSHDGCQGTCSEHSGHRVVRAERLNDAVHRLMVEAPRIAAVRQAGQFVIVHQRDGAERIPLTIAEADASAGTVTLVVQAVGRSTRDLVALEAGDVIAGVAGPLGRPTELVAGGHAVCVGGGVGTAVVLPIARALHERGTTVTSIVGGRSAGMVLYERELGALGDVVVCTDDGSAGRAGVVTTPLAELVARGGIDVVYAAGPVPMMRAVAATTAPDAVRTIVSLNPIMVDGTGMCGGCRVTVDGHMRFACVDGPEFEAHGVDFDELVDRLGTYRTFERAADGAG